MSDAEETNEGGNGAGPSGARSEDATTPEQRLAALEAERDETKDRMLRIAAEFENWKKRARKEKDDGEAQARESVLRDMLDVLDNLERAMGAYKAESNGKAAGQAAAGAPGTGDGPAVLKGIELVLRLFQSKLDRYGMKAIAAAGQPFDPRLHEAISRVETTDVPPGHVATELQRGYMIGDRLVRPSMVAVATPPSGTGGGGGSVGRKGVDGESGGTEDKSA